MVRHLHRHRRSQAHRGGPAQSEALFRGTFENAAVGIDHVDLEGRFLRINQKFCEILGYTHEEMFTKTWMELTHPADLAADLELYGRLLRGELASYTMEKRFIRNDRSTVWVDLTVTFHRDAAGRPVYCIAIFQDISERKRLEEALRESEEMFRGTFENAAVGIVHNDSSGRFLRVNDRFCAIVGYPREELLQKTFQDITHPDDLATSLGFLEALVRGESPAARYEKRYIRKDGTPVWVALITSLQRDAAGQPAYVIAVVQDISERKRLEGALRESEARFRTLAEALPTMVWTAEPDGTIDYINSRLIEYTGLTLEQLRDRDQGSTLHPEDRHRCIEQWMRSVATGEPYEVEYRPCRADGAFRWHLGQALPLRDESGRITRWFGSITDIDDQKRAAEELREAKEAAEAANRAKDEFLANVSHEIRTPMNAILGMTELALDTLLTEDQRQYLTTVKSAADALLAIINDILDFAKIEAGRLELDPTDFSLSPVLGATLRALAVRATRRGWNWYANSGPMCPMR